MKCKNCRSEVSMWATVCPYCHRNPGNIVENTIIGFIRWLFILGFIIGGIATLFSGGYKSNQPVNKQSVKPQQQTTQTVKNINNKKNAEYERKKQQEIEKKKQAVK